GGRRKRFGGGPSEYGPRTAPAHGAGGENHSTGKEKLPWKSRPASTARRALCRYSRRPAVASRRRSATGSISTISGGDDHAQANGGDRLAGPDRRRRADGRRTRAGRRLRGAPRQRP